LLVVASDIAAAPWHESLGKLSAALETDAGLAMAVRAVLVAMLAAVMFLPLGITSWARWTVAGGCAIGALATWAYSGHAQSMRWAFLGLPLDVAHHAAAAAWLGGLAIVGLVAMRRCAGVELVDVAQRFSRLAFTAVVVIVATGVVQALRLVGSPAQLFATDHGRYLVGKIAVIVLMLALADANRRRVNKRFRRPGTAGPRAAADLGRAMAMEMFAGLAVLGITAAMVVSPPATADDSASNGSQAEANAEP
jgi:copper transport protein